MGKYKLLAIDLDDTLLDGQLEVPELSRQAIQTARDQGVLVTLATGRMFRAALPYARQLGLDDYLITYQGALVRHAGSGELLLHRPVPLPLALEVVEAVQGYGYHINIYLDDELYVAEHNEASQRYVSFSPVPVHEVGDLIPYLRQRGEDPTKVLTVAREELLDELMAVLKPVFGDSLHINKSKPYFLEFSHPQANKGDALAAVASHYGVERNEIIAMGDGYNDVEMIAYAGLGVVVGNARREIRELADYVSRSNEESGVAEVVEKFILRG